MIHPSVEQFKAAMEFKGLAPCPQDGRWEIPTDSDICTEVETLQLLFGMVRTIRPKVVVETGCNVGCAAAVIVAALVANGTPYPEGVLYSCDIEEAAVVAAYERLGHPIERWLITKEDGLELIKRHAHEADLYWIDSSDSSRMAELHWIRDHGKKGAVVLTHDTNLIGHVTEVHRTLPNWVLLPGPRGLGIATL